MLIPSFAKVSQRVSDLQTPTVGLMLGWSQMLKDGCTYGHTKGWKKGSLYRAMPERGATKIKSDTIQCQGMSSKSYKKDH